MDNDTMIYFGDAIRSMGDDGKVGGYLVRFTGPKDVDIYGAFFTRETDFDVEDGQRISLYYHHGMDGTMKSRRIGKGTLRIDDVGVWIEAQLDLHDRYVQALNEMGIKAGKMGWSSGALGHLVEFETIGQVDWIKTWPIGEASITPTPAERRNEVIPLRSLINIDREQSEAEVQAEEGSALNAETTAAPHNVSDVARVQLRARAYLMTSEELWT